MNVSREAVRSNARPSVKRKRAFYLVILCGRGDWIRTSDQARPRHVRYQAALHPERPPFRRSWPRREPGCNPAPSRAAEIRTRTLARRRMAARRRLDPPRHSCATLPPAPSPPRHRRIPVAPASGVPPLQRRCRLVCPLTRPLASAAAPGKRLPSPCRIKLERVSLPRVGGRPTGDPTHGLRAPRNNLVRGMIDYVTGASAGLKAVPELAPLAAPWDQRKLALRADRDARDDARGRVLECSKVVDVRDTIWGRCRRRARGRRCGRGRLPRRSRAELGAEDRSGLSAAPERQVDRQAPPSLHLLAGPSRKGLLSCAPFRPPTSSRR